MASRARSWCLIDPVSSAGSTLALPAQPATRAQGPGAGQGKEFRLLVFDLETQKSAADVGGWDKAHLMRMSVGVVHKYTLTRRL